MSLQFYYIIDLCSRHGLVVDSRARIRKVASSSPGECSSPELTFCADSHLVSVPLRVTTVARKNLGHSAKSAGGRLNLSTHTPLIQLTESAWADYAVQA